MHRYPRLMVKVYEKTLSGALREIGNEDLTAAALRTMDVTAREGCRLVVPLPSVRDFYPMLSPEAQKAASSGRLRIPELAAAFSAFSAEVRLRGGSEALIDLLKSKELCRQSVKAASALLRNVMQADMCKRDDFTHFADPLTGEILQDTIRNVSWGKIAKSLYGSSASAQLVGRGRGSKLFSDVMDWYPRSLPPFMFGTVRAVWKGIDPHLFETYVLSEGVEIPELIAKGLGDHILEGELVETWRLDEAAADYLEREPSPGSRKSMAEAVNYWNAIQSAEVILPDTSAVVPIGEGTTKAGMEEWCRGHLESVIEAYDMELPEAKADGPRMALG